MSSKCKPNLFNKTRRKQNFCSTCSLQFGNQKVFKLHNKILHPEKLKKSETYEPIMFPCTHCRERFSSITTYNMHFSFVHSDIIVKQQARQIETLKKKHAIVVRNLGSQVTNANRFVENLKIKLENIRSCKICFEREIDTLYLPCSHCIACHRCSDHETIKTCPICREEIDSKLRVKF